MFEISEELECPSSDVGAVGWRGDDLFEEIAMARLRSHVRRWITAVVS
jgi:hypothetical protein